MDCAGIEKSVYGKDNKRTKVYYCHPYSAYERGTNENINKMIRRFLPKGTDFRKVTAEYIRRVETVVGMNKRLLEIRIDCCNMVNDYSEDIARVFAL